MSVLQFVLALVVGGCLCAFFQFIVSATHWNPQHVLIGSISLGAILMPFGVMGTLESIGGAGAIATFMDAGAAFAGTLVAGFTAGNWMAFGMIICIVVLQIPLGIFAGSLYAKRHPEEFERAE
ncbi:MAG: hypothetical protein IJF97_07290 [Eggerthellaceae bacterium]|nr:hypothetical protein [Eggerthellaceae bacterium]